MQELSEDNKNLDLPTGIHIEPATPEQSIPLEPREGDSKAVKTDIFVEFQKKREARTAKTTEDTNKLYKTSEEKVSTEQFSKLAPEQPKYTENIANKLSEVIPVPVTETQNLERAEISKEITEQSKLVSEPRRPKTEILQSISEPQKVIGELQKPGSESLKLTELQKPVSELSKPASKQSESISEVQKTVSIPQQSETEPTKSESEPLRLQGELSKLTSKPLKPESQQQEPINIQPKIESQPPKSINELQKLVSEPEKFETETLKIIAENTIFEAQKPVTELLKPTTEPSKGVPEANLVIEISKLSKPLSLETEEGKILLQSQPVNKHLCELSKPTTEIPYPESNQIEPTSKRPKLESEPTEPKTELSNPVSESLKPPKSISELPKHETESQKLIAENLLIEPPIPTSDPKKTATQSNPIVEPSRPLSLETEEKGQCLKSQTINIPLSFDKTTEDTQLSNKQRLKEEKLQTEFKQETVSGLKRKESADIVSDKKVKIEEDTKMDGYSSYTSRTGTRHMEVEGNFTLVIKKKC